MSRAMKKMIISIVACFGLLFAAFLAWASYHDFLAAVLFASAMIPSCLFEQGRQEYKKAKKDA